MNTDNYMKLFVEAVAQLQKDHRFLEKKKAISDGNPRKPKLTMVDFHYFQLLPSLIFNFEKIIEEIEDGSEPFDTDVMIAQTVIKLNAR